MDEQSPKASTNQFVRRLLIVIGALFLSSLMLAGWFTSVSWARTSNQDPPPGNPLAPQSFTFIKSTNVPKFSIGLAKDTGNQYLISTRIDSLPYPTQLRVEDTLPAGITISDTKGTVDWNCSILNNRTFLSCTYSGNDPPIGQSYKTIFVNVNIATSVVSQVTNTARLIVDGTQAAEATRITDIDSVDLRIRKTASRQFADVGEVINYTISYHNSGPATATAVKIVDVVPTSLNITGLSVATTSQTSTSTLKYLTWQFGNLSTNVTNTILMTASPLASASGRQLTNNVSVTSSNISDWRPSNNTASATVFVSGLEIHKQLPAGLTSVFVGQPFTYTITVRNNGTTTASGVSVTDVFTRGLSIIGAKITTNSTSTTFSTGNNMNRFIGTMAPGQVSVIEVGVRANSTVTVTKTITNQAFVRASPSIIRESDVVTITKAKPAADFVVTNSDGLSSVIPGQPVTYTVTIQNIGSVVTATQFTVTDTLLQHLDFVRVDLGTLVYTPTFISADNRIHVWKIGKKLLPNETISYKIAAKVRTTAPTGADAIHRVVARSPDEKYLGNNRVDDLDRVTIPPNQNFNFLLAIDRTRVEVGEGILFRIDLENIGNTIAVNARVTDIFPSVLDIVTGETTLGTLTINASTRTVTTNLGSLSPGQKVRISISTRVNSTATTSASYEHTAQLSFNPNITISSNTVRFQVIAGGVLPGTGAGPPGVDNPLQGGSTALLLMPLALLAPLVILSRRWSRRPVR